LAATTVLEIMGVANSVSWFPQGEAQIRQVAAVVSSLFLAYMTGALLANSKSKQAPSSWMVKLASTLASIVSTAEQKSESVLQFSAGLKRLSDNLTVLVVAIGALWAALKSVGALGS
jgi:hypothetical protein